MWKSKVGEYFPFNITSRRKVFFDTSLSTVRMTRREMRVKTTWFVDCHQFFVSVLDSIITQVPVGIIALFKHEKNVFLLKNEVTIKLNLSFVTKNNYLIIITFLSIIKKYWFGLSTSAVYNSNGYCNFLHKRVKT